MLRRFQFAPVARWLLPIAALVSWIGYFGPWVHHPVAGLVITGLDLGEYVKFLPAVRYGHITIWREGFYLPLLNGSLLFIFIAYRPRLHYPVWVRFLLLILAAVSAFNLLPPAWSPQILLSTEFRAQSGALFIALLLLASSPFVGLLPLLMIRIISSLLALGALWWPLSTFLMLLPDIASLYQQPLQPGWGMYLLIIGNSIQLLGLWLPIRTYQAVEEYAGSPHSRTDAVIFAQEQDSTAAQR
jgi:hypothetical protein